MVGTAIGEIVAVDAGNHDVTEFHCSGHAGYVSGFRGIERHVVDSRISFGHGTKAAAARAEVAEDHESGGATVEAFVNIGAPGRLANCVEIKGPEFGLQFI